MLITKKQKAKREEWYQKYSAATSIEEVMQFFLKNCKIQEKIDVVLTLKLKIKKKKFDLRGNCSLPHAFRPAKKIGVFANAVDPARIIAMGAYKAGGKELVAQIIKDGPDCETYIATKDILAVVAIGVGKILGPRKIMPNLKDGTLIQEEETHIQNAINKFSAGGSISFRSNSDGTLHTSIGSCGLSAVELIENLKGLVLALMELRPLEIDAKSFIRKVVVSSTQGPGVVLTRSMLLEILAI